MIRWIIIILAVLGIGAGWYYYMYPSAQTPQTGEEAGTSAVSEGETAALEAELTLLTTGPTDA